MNEDELSLLPFKAFDILLVRFLFLFQSHGFLTLAF